MGLRQLRLGRPRAHATSHGRRDQAPRGVNIGSLRTGALPPASNWRHVSTGGGTCRERPKWATLLRVPRPRGAVMSIRPVKRIVEARPTIEGAGVKLRRAFGFGDTAETDPFLLLDDFRNERPADYLAGFPWHPHRGIETITYVLTGTVSHGDSLGTAGTLGAGDIQWLTPGRRLHQPA